MRSDYSRRFYLVTLFATVAFVVAGCSGGSGGNDDDDLDCSDPANATDPACEINCDDPENLTNPGCMITRCEENPDLPECEERVCFNPVDCDGDGLSGACDADDYDGENLGIRSTCDADGDGHIDVVCTGASVPLTVGSISCDNCIGTANPDQTDRDGDGFGDACDSLDCVDGDGDLVCDSADNCPEVFNHDQTADIDGDGIGDVCDSDKDGDGSGNGADNCPDIANPGQADRDRDNIGDSCDSDRDGDGIKEETYPGGGAIEREDGEAVDECPIIAPTPANLDNYAVTGTALACLDDDEDDVCQHYEKWNGCCFDTDEDTICDHLEGECVNIINSDFLDNCGLGDTDNDGVVNDQDNCTSTYNPNQADMDGDASTSDTNGGDACDSDIDGDGMKNSHDLCDYDDSDVWLLAYNVDDSNIRHYQYFFHRQLVVNSVLARFARLLGSLGQADLDGISPDTYRFIPGLSSTIGQISRAGNYQIREGIRNDLADKADSSGYSYDADDFHLKGTFQCDGDGDNWGCACDPDDTDPDVVGAFSIAYITF